MCRVLREVEIGFGANWTTDWPARHHDRGSRAPAATSTCYEQHKRVRKSIGTNAGRLVDLAPSGPSMLRLLIMNLRWQRRRERLVSPQIFRVQTTQFDPRVAGCELPIDLTIDRIA